MKVTQRVSFSKRDILQFWFFEGTGASMELATDTTEDERADEAVTEEDFELTLDCESLFGSFDDCIITVKRLKPGK